MVERSTAFGLLNVNKPAGPTSHDIVARVRRGTGIKKIGHAGTLDPMATGVLILCVGAATRLSEYVMASRKVYRARVHFGVETDTYDAEGAVVAEQPADHLTREAVEAALDPFRGEIEQVPPMYSAIQQGGRRLYDLARAGQDVPREARAVTIFRLDLLAWEPPVATLEVACSPGTYIRSLAHDLGEALGTGAHLAALERAASGRFTVEDAVKWDALEAAMADGTWRRWLLPADLAVADLPRVTLDAEQAAAIRHGQWIPAVDPPGDDGLARAYDEAGAFVAVVERKGAHWKPHKVFQP
jgi:tRNA pseudouridine55 synthase